MLVFSSSKEDCTVKMEVSSSNELTVDGVLLLSGDEKGESVPSEIALRAFTTEVSMGSRHLLTSLREIWRWVAISVVPIPNPKFS